MTILLTIIYLVLGLKTLQIVTINGALPISQNHSSVHHTLIVAAWPAICFFYYDQVLVRYFNRD